MARRGNIAYGQAVKRPFTDWGKTLLGTLISLVPILNLAGYAYMIEALRRPRAPMPSWKPFKKRWMDGLFAFLVVVIYAIPALIFIAITEFQDTPSLVIGGISYAFAIIAYYFVPSAWINFVQKGRFGAAFQKSVFNRALTGRYLKVWITTFLISSIVGLVFGAIGFALIFTVVVPWIIAAFSAFVIFVIMGTIYGMFAVSG